MLFFGCVQHKVECHCRLAYAGTSCQNDKFATFKSVCNAVQTFETCQNALRSKGVVETILNFRHNFAQNVLHGYKFAHLSCLRKVVNFAFGKCQSIFVAVHLTCLFDDAIARFNQRTHQRATFDNFEIIFVLCTGRQQRIDFADVIYATTYLGCALTIHFVNQRGKT